MDPGRGADRAGRGAWARVPPLRPQPARAPAAADFDLGRGLGQLTGDGHRPAVIAVLLTAADGRADWLRAGQALYRLLLHATTSWVSASLYTQPLEAAVTRALIRDQLTLPGQPQVLLQFGFATNVCTTARRPFGDLTGP